MPHEPILSIILPVYNGEAFVKRAIQSVLDQKLQNWELVVVNDGSTDASESIITSYCERDSRIIKITQANGGLSAARNAGFCRSTGKYIVFLDVDDWVEESYYSDLVAYAEKYKTEFLVSSYIRDFVQSGGRVKAQQVRFEEKVLDTNEKLKQACEQMHFYNVYIHVWNKIYRREFLLENRIMFDEGRRYAEDVPYNIEVLKNTSSILFVDIPGYHYVCHQAERLTGSWKESLLEDNCQVYHQIAAFEKEFLNMEQSEVAAGMYLRSCFLAIEKTISMKMPYQDVCVIMKTLFEKTALKDSLDTLKYRCRSKEFYIYMMILQIKSAFIFYIAVTLRRGLKRMLGR